MQENFHKLHLIVLGEGKCGIFSCSSNVPGKWDWNCTSFMNNPSRWNCLCSFSRGNILFIIAFILSVYQHFNLKLLQTESFILFHQFSTNFDCLWSQTRAPIFDLSWRCGDNTSFYFLTFEKKTCFSIIFRLKSTTYFDDPKKKRVLMILNKEKREYAM